jgi:hypothetical protein
MMNYLAQKHSRRGPESMPSGFDPDAVAQMSSALTALSDNSMNIRRKRFNWIIGACVVSVIHGLGGFASRADAQTPASRIATRSAVGAASTAQDADPTNAQLQHRVAAALHAQRHFVDRHIDVSAHGGVVELNGIVFSDWDLRDALRTARKAAGGRPLVDNLSIEEGGR